MSRNTKASLIVTAALVAVIAVVIAVIVLVQQRQDQEAAQRLEEAGGPAVVRDDTHVLGAEGSGEVTVVEFLDFECEVCGAMYPFVEQAREEYAGEVTFMFRYFPIPSHVNSMNAALAVEAAAQQGQLEGMYARMFETQAEWGDAVPAVDASDRFRGYADELGLDMMEYDATVADPGTEARIQADFEEGQALGVQGTPTFFVDGEAIELQMTTDLDAAIQAALAN